MNYTSDKITRPYSHEDCLSVFGPLAAHVYGGKAVTYYREFDAAIREILIVVNGVIVEHYAFEHAHPHARVEIGVSMVGLPAWGERLRSRRFFRLLSVTSDVEYHRSRKLS